MCRLGELTSRGTILITVFGAMILSACTSASVTEPGVRQLTVGFGTCNHDDNPTWTPDGQLVFERSCSGLLSMNPDNGAIASIPNTRNGEGCASVSPDNTRILFASTRSDPNTWEVLVMNLDGTGLSHLIATGKEGACAHWSPDGKRVAISKINENYAEVNYALYVVKADGTNPVRLTDPPFSPLDAAWDPMGKRIAFIDGLSNEMYIISADGGDPIQVTSDGWYKSWRISWSPDGNWIVFSGAPADGKDPPGLYAVHPDGTGKRLLLDKPFAFQPAFSPKGDWVAFVHQPPAGGKDVSSINLVKVDALLK